MDYINKYLRNFKPYKLASHKIWDASKEERSNILKLDWNEATIAPSPLVKERLMKLIMEDSFFNLYPSTHNKKLTAKLAIYCGLPDDNVQYFASSDSLHEYIAKLYISVGDPVLIIWPSYDNFRLTCEINGGFVNYYEFDQDFNFNQDAFLRAMDRIKPSLAYICNPNNPTGYLHSIKFIESLLVKYPNTMFLVDEAYYEFAGKDTSCSSLVLKYENLLISRTMSKAFAIANFRFGYLIASEKNIQYISTIRNPKNITTFAQEAAIAVLDDQEYMWNYVKEVNLAKVGFVNKLKSMGIESFESHGNFVLIKVANPEVKKNLQIFLESRNIYVRNVNQSNGLENCLRLTIGTREQMERVIENIELFYMNKNAKN